MEVHLEHLVWNLHELQNRMPEGCECMAVVKADAYGHGATAVASCLEREGVSTFAVATLEEGIELRNHGIQGTILILGYTDPQCADYLERYRLTQTVVDLAHAKALNEAGAKCAGRKLAVHVKVDTGMHRLGEDYKNTAHLKEMFQMEQLDIQGMYTHLCVADDKRPEEQEFTHRQIKRFFDTVEELKKEGCPIPKLHLLSSYGFLNYSEYSCDYVRLGILLYGTYSNDTKEGYGLELRPVMTVKARIAEIKQIEAGDSVSYGRRFIAATPCLTATITIGYADGIPRDLSEGRGSVLIHGRRALILGRVCMDQMVVDVTNIPEAAQGDVVTVIGRDGDEEIRASEVAGEAGTITNELLSRIGTRLRKEYI